MSFRFSSRSLHESRFVINTSNFSPYYISNPVQCSVNKPYYIIWITFFYGQGYKKILAEKNLKISKVTFKSYSAGLIRRWAHTGPSSINHQSLSGDVS